MLPYLYLILIFIILLTSHAYIISAIELGNDFLFEKKTSQKNGILLVLYNLKCWYVHTVVL